MCPYLAVFDEKAVSLHSEIKNVMRYDLLKPVSQGSDGAQTEENRRIAEVADELRRCCQLYEAQLRNSKGNVNALDIEQHCAEQLAKKHGCWISIEHISNLGEPGPCGNENDIYVSNDIIYKVNNLLNSGSILVLLDRIIWHNSLFYDTSYSLYGFTGFGGRSVMPVLQQRLVKNARPATQVMIDTYMSALGFTKTDHVGSFTNGTYEAWDLLPRNVLVDDEGDMYVVDAEIKKL